MTTQKSFTTDNDLLSSSLENDVLVIRQKQHIKTLTQDVNAIYSFYEYQESILSSKSYKAMVMFACPDKDEYIEYSMFLSKALSAKKIICSLTGWQTRSTTSSAHYRDLTALRFTPGGERSQCFT